MRPTRPPTMIEVPREMRTSHARLHASACVATTAHQAVRAITTMRGNGMASSRHEVASPPITTNAASRRQAASANATLASLYLLASISDLLAHLSPNALTSLSEND